MKVTPHFLINHFVSSAESRAVPEEMMWRRAFEEKGSRRVGLLPPIVWARNGVKSFNSFTTPTSS